MSGGNEICFPFAFTAAGTTIVENTANCIVRGLEFSLYINISVAVYPVSVIIQIEDGSSNAIFQRTLIVYATGSPQFDTIRPIRIRSICPASGLKVVCTLGAGSGFNIQGNVIYERDT